MGALAALLGIGVFLYWQSLKDEPEYSLASIIDAAKRGDQAAHDQLVDSDAIVDSMMPAITDKAIEIYGRGLSREALSKIEAAAVPLLPIAKQRARSELPGFIRRETERFGDVPFPLMVLGASRYLDINVEGDSALIKAKNPERKTEVRMIRNGNKWKIVAVRDERMATEVARRIGLELIGLTSTPGTSGNSGIDKLLRQIEKETQ